MISCVCATVALGGCASSTASRTTQVAPAPAAATVTSARPDTSALRQQWLEMFARGYFPGRSGQVFLVSREGDIITSRDPLYPFMHGSPWDYDTRIPVLFYGAPFVRQGQSAEAAKQQDVAPTLGAIIGAPAIATYTGRVLPGVTAAGAGRPRVAVIMVLDAMRAEYFDQYAAVMPTLSRMRREGAWFSDARTIVLPTVTGVGHANIGTGSEPRIHGITVNTLFNRVTGKSQEAYDALDPKELMALTLGDTWNLATDGRAVIIGQGGAIRAVAGLVGRGSCLVGARKVTAASYNAVDGGWESNPACYDMPRALAAFNAKTVWDAAGGKWMGHDIASGSKFRASSLFQKYEAEALRAVVEDSAIGADEVTDLIMVNMKGPDYTAHAYGPDSAEQKETLAELDRQMAAFLALLDRKAGPGRSVVAVTADHGMPGEPGAGRRHHPDEIIPLINARFDPEGKIIQNYSDAANSQIYIDTERLRARGFSLKDVATMLEGLEFVAAAFTEDEVRAALAAIRPR
jgi:hypothetical protein